MIRSVVIVFALAFLVLSLLLMQRQDPGGPLIRTRMLMGTVVEIKVDEPDAERYETAVTAAFNAMERIEDLMSLHVPESDVSRLAAAGGPVRVAPETLEVLQVALEVAAASGGAFDPTLGRLVRLWGFADGHPRLPEPAEIEAAIGGPGLAGLEVDGRLVSQKSAKDLLDLGGIAKGYAIDRAIEVLAAAGVRHAAVNAGGDMRLLGERSGRPWKIGIQHPRQAGEVLGILELGNQAVVTSGDYERAFEQNGVHYHHILDPRTGYPADLCQAVTVVADRTVFADALATAVFVLGPERGMALLNSTPGAEGLIVAADGKISVTPGLREVVTWR